jgi:hypothetical protein
MSKPSGLYVLHNTIIAENGNSQTFSNAHYRNNLFLGTNAHRPIAVFPFATTYSTSDYNGYRPNKAAREQYVWISPPKGELRNYQVTNKDAIKFSSLRDFARASGLEAHSIELDYDIFINLKAPDTAMRHGIYYATDLDFRLNPKGKAIDRGVALPNINDNYKGKAPDLGALEGGDIIPVYGPRNAKNQSFYR